MRRYLQNSLLLRCYGYKTDARWYGVCIDLNLAIEADNITELKKKMSEVIETYIDTVIDTEDKDSIPDLLSRSAPLKDWVLYYLIKTACITKHIHGKITFKKSLPFQIAHNY